LAQSDLGDAYRIGKGVPQDYAEAMKWYRKAAEQGSEYSQLIISSLFMGRMHSDRISRTVPQIGI
jgi:TPR repeat protein